ncbi:uncharacterized protein SPSK_00677 [Sporothrix schenckii 1099-18]|uniref:Zn(2)-C6 fungal-type domain-containing protein n=1 Tax=Sporothrix schenckii 1099-18 TaxID=1397361 RepID=A0A0F2LYC0_SPOSC|nr:uncharacterized protein SPSK_00677 [Sporothrix schenckii 1099-18]KJR81859.1 hypothetical protein SPSK_00677 [Sporothrix schenckii 1099-18]
MEPLPGGVPTVAGRTPIACQNCANAKTGCDKRVPCSRCAEKNLPCAARFARRSSKAAVRAAQASAAAAAAAAAFTAQMATSPTHSVGPQPLTPAAFIDLEHQQQQQHHSSMVVAGTSGMKLDSPPLRTPLGLEQMVVGDATGLNMCLSDPSVGLAPSQLHHQHRHHSHQQQQQQQQQQQPHHLHQHAHMQHVQLQDAAHPFGQSKKSPLQMNNHLSPDNFNSPQGVRGVDGLDEFMGFGGSDDFVGPETSYQDLIWADYPMDMDIYANPLQLGRPSDMAAAAAAGLIPPFTATTELSDISSSSEPMTVSSSQGSVHTRGTSILSSTGTGEYEGRKNSTASTGHGLNSMSDLGRVASSIHVNGKSFVQQQQQQQYLQQPLTMFDMAAMAPCSEGSIPEFEVVVASEAAWPLARCTPPIYSGACPRTAIVHLECLEQKSKQDGTWTALEQFLDSHQAETINAPQVVPLTSRSRDKMLAITQSFLHKALDIHRSGMYPKNGATSPGSADFNFNFIVLPPSRILEYFLKSYVHSLAIYYPLIVGGVVDPNEMLDNSQASTLLVLLMIAQGAATVPMAEARYLSAGLSETCRISLFDIIEKNVELSADPTALRCALLFTLLGAWSGDKWQMDIAMGQRSMYLSMLKHAGMLEPQPSMVPSLGSPMNAELRWRSWLHRESQNRLVYNWVMVDQELSLFHDTAPVLSISDLQCPLPSSEALWLAPTAERWAAIAQSTYSTSSNASSSNSASASSVTPSLCELFQDFLHDNLARRKTTLSPQQLRLLLHPLQGLLCHLRQMLSCLPEVPPVRRTTNRTVTKASTMQRLEEVQAQLQHWYELSMAYYKANPGCAVTKCNLVLYHLISLNAVTNFPEIERLARRDGFSNSTEPSVRHKRCIFLREEAIFHCGQVLRVLRQMPSDRRPSWWSAALYRAVLILWAESVCHLDSNAAEQQQTGNEPSNIAASAAGSRSAVAGTASPTLIGSPLKTGPTLSPGLSPRSQGGHPSGNGVSDGANAPSSSATSLVAIDSVTPEDQAVIAYLWGGDGVTAVLTHSDGRHFTLDTPSEILAYGVKRIDEASSTRISDGIRRKLLSLASNWAGQVLV